MKSKNIVLMCFLISSLLLVLSSKHSFGNDIERNNIFKQNKFLQLQPNGRSFSQLDGEIKPSLDLKGGSVQEEKELMSAFYLLGFTTNTIAYNYDTYPLGSKMGDSTVKANLISSLRNLRDLMAQVEAENALLELITEISDKIENEDIKSKKSNPETLALLNELSGRINEHIKNTFGLSYSLYYSFGSWTNEVMTFSELIVLIDGLGEKDISKSEKEKVLTNLSDHFKGLLELASLFKAETEELTVKAVTRNLNSIQEIASEIKTSIDAKTAKRLYDYSLNIYFGIVPQK